MELINKIIQLFDTHIGEHQNKAEFLMAADAAISDNDETLPGYGYWDQHPDYPVEDWIYHVQCDDTRLSYWGWVRSEIEAASAIASIPDLDTDKDKL